MSAKRKRQITRKLRQAGFTPQQIAARLAKQETEERQQRELTKAKAALKSFRVKKSDRGKLVFIGTQGKRNPQEKGRNGYLINVTSTGKKELVRTRTKGKRYAPIKPEKITNIKIPFQKRFAKKAKEFEVARLVTVRKGRIRRPIIRGRGNLATGSSAYDFNATVVSKISASIAKALRAVKSHRIFLISVNVLVRLNNGETRVFSFTVPIERPDHVAIELGGVVNWTKKKFYAAMANELRYEGLVSSGSANHIRNLKENYGASKRSWTQQGEAWRGQDLEIVKILTIEWKIEQSR